MSDVVKIPLHGKRGEGLYATVDASDLALVEGYVWFAVGNYRTVYAKANLHYGKSVLMHRLLLPVAPHHIDHVDRDGLNNRRCNLRPATAAQNLCNRGLDRNNASGFKGVAWHKRGGKWQAYIKYEGRRTHLGLFCTPEEAARAYDTKAIELHGDFALTNAMLGLLW